MLVPLSALKTHLVSEQVIKAVLGNCCICQTKLLLKICTKDDHKTSATVRKQTNVDYKKKKKKSWQWEKTKKRASVLAFYTFSVAGSWWKSWQYLPQQFASHTCSEKLAKVMHPLCREPHLLAMFWLDSQEKKLAVLTIAVIPLRTILRVFHDVSFHVSSWHTIP